MSRSLSLMSDLRIWPLSGSGSTSRILPRGSPSMNSMIMNAPNPRGLSFDVPQAMTNGMGMLVSVLINCIVATSRRTFSSPFITFPGTAKRTIHCILSSNRTLQDQLKEPQTSPTISQGRLFRKVDSQVAMGGPRTSLKLPDHVRESA